MTACAWCGATTNLRTTKPGPGALPGQQPIRMCVDRRNCRRVAETRTRLILTRTALQGV